MFQYAASQRVFDRRGVIYSGLGSCSTRRQKNLAGSSLLRLLIWLQKEVPVAMFDRLLENSSYLSDLLIIQRIAPKPSCDGKTPAIFRTEGILRCGTSYSAVTSPVSRS